MIPRLVMAWAALVHDRYLGEMVEFLRDNPYGLRFDDLVDDIPAAPGGGRSSRRDRLPCRVHVGGAFHELLL